MRPRRWRRQLLRLQHSRSGGGERNECGAENDLGLALHDLEAETAENLAFVKSEMHVAKFDGRNLAPAIIHLCESGFGGILADLAVNGDVLPRYRHIKV